MADRVRSRSFVVTACAARALGGDMQGRLWLRDAEHAEIAASEGIDPARTLELNDLCCSDQTLLAVTGVTDGELLRDVRFEGGAAYTQSIVISAFTRTLRMSECKYVFIDREATDESAGAVSQKLLA